MADETPLTSFKLGDASNTAANTETNPAVSVSNVAAEIPPVIAGVDHNIPPPPWANAITHEKPLKEAAEDTIKRAEEKTGIVKIRKWVVFLPLIAIVGTGLYYAYHGSETLKNGWKKSIATQVPEIEKTVPEIKPEAPINIPTQPPKSSNIDEIRDYYLRLALADGSIEVRTGGSNSWRTNNPCFILYGKFSQGKGAIGGYPVTIAKKKVTASVFDSYELGYQACYDLLFNSEHGYKELTVADAVRRFAPQAKRFNTAKYLRAVRTAKINDGLITGELDEGQRKRLVESLIKIEDFIPGKVVKFRSADEFKERGY